MSSICHSCLKLRDKNDEKLSSKLCKICHRKKMRLEFLTETHRKMRQFNMKTTGSKVVDSEIEKHVGE